MTSSPHESAGIIHMESGVSAFTGKPFVQFRWGRESGQLTADEAAAHALAALECAMAARIDAAVFAELTDPAAMNLPKETAARFISSLRKHQGR